MWCLSKGREIKIESLDGYGIADTSASSYGNLQTTPKNNISYKAEWIIKTSDEQVEVVASNNKSGKASKIISIDK